MFKNKKAQMGIETLIIFIAMILVAAIAASVLIRTSGVLQERAFAVANNAREALVTKIELISVYGLVDMNASPGSEDIYGLEIRAKLGPGSYPIQLNSVSLSFVSPSANLGASVALSPFDSLMMSLGTMTNGTTVSLGDVTGDDFADYVTLYTGSPSYLYFNYSDGTNATVYLQSSSGAYYDISAVPQIIWMQNVPIPYRDTLIGFLNIMGPQSTVGLLNSSEMGISINKTSTICDINHVIPETRICFPVVPNIVNDNTIMEQGEVFLFDYRLLPGNYLHMNEDFTLSLIPKAGAEESREMHVPDVLNKPRIELWPN